MTTRLDELIASTRNVKMTADQKEQQRRSFAYGNAKTENEKITRASLDEQAEKMLREKNAS